MRVGAGPPLASFICWNETIQEVAAFVIPMDIFIVVLVLTRQPARDLFGAFFDKAVCNAGPGRQRLVIRQLSLFLVSVAASLILG